MLSDTSGSGERQVPPNHWHDVGGTRLEDPIEILPDKPLELWEAQTDALVTTLISKGFLRVDELRRGVEALAPDFYESMAYYERWGVAITGIMLEKGVVTSQELVDAFAGDDISGDSVPQVPLPRFEVGQTVWVRPEELRTRWRKPHLRTPGYVHGRVGIVERVCGDFEDPELLAFGGILGTSLVPPASQASHQQTLYRVRFKQADIWEHYDGSNEDTVDVEIFGNWLQSAALNDSTPLPTFSSSGGGGGVMPVAVAPHDHHGDGEHDHDHDHHHDDEDHVHLTRPEIEQNAVNGETEETVARRVTAALRRALVNKGVLNGGELRAAVEKLEAGFGKYDAARMVARAWVDPAYRELLLTDATAAATELGLVASNNTASTVLTVVANEPGKVHNVVVCTLCSCYPRSLLGMPPSWYKSRSYRARTVRQPRAVLREFGLTLPDATAIRVHDSTADLRYIVLPSRPEGTEGLSEEELVRLVARDSMIGVALPYNSLAEVP